MLKKEGKFVIAPVNMQLLEETLNLTKEQEKELTKVYEDVAQTFKAGSLMTGSVVSKEGSGVLVSVGYKSDGFIPQYEFSDFELEKLSEGSEIEVLLDRLEDADGNVVLSYQKAKSLKAWGEISKIAEKDEAVTGRVTHKVKGGLSVDVGIPAFLPGSQIDLHRVNDFDQFIGQDVTCKVLKINRRRGNIIVSRRKYMEELRIEDKKKALETIQEGQIVPGIVKNITNYGAFVDVGGIDGLLHITDMSWGRIGHPSEMVKIGDEISVKILTFDKDHEKISLGLKQLNKNPWDEVGKRYPVNSKVKGTISSIADYGLFVEVERGIEGLVHISEISWTERVHNLAKRYTVGQELEVLVAALDKDNRRMSLSIKRLADDPWKVAFDKFKPGDMVTGTVSNVADFGIFVKIHEGVDGLVHVSDISWTEHVAHPSDKFKRGDEVKVLILSVDKENRRISLGVKQLDRDPWETIEEDFPVGKEVSGTVSKVTSFGAFVKFPNGIEGLAHVSELSNNEVEDVESLLKVGMEAKFKVVKSSKHDRKLGLSLRAINEPEETAAAEKRTVPPKRQSVPRPNTEKKRHPESFKKKRFEGPSTNREYNDRTPTMKGALQQALEKMKDIEKETASEENKSSTNKKND
ncbi:30S ribosomal protein S1 [Candidatus Babeliales bacterium]|nr:30S ribosomal protein S1 [Candidatus Babeliales bacterium]